MNTKRFFICFALGVCLPLHSSVAMAQEQEDAALEQARINQALSFMEEGFAHFSEKNYGQAITAWKKSFEVYPTGISQLNIARAYAQLKEFEQARAALKVARGESSVPLELPLNKLERIELEKFELDLTQQERDDQAKQRAKLLEEKQKACRAQATRLASMGRVGLGVAGAGLLSLGGTAFFAARARSQFSALKPPHTQGEEQFNAEVDAFETSQQRAKITLGVGAGLLLLGGGLTAYDLTTLDYEEPECKELMDKPQEDALSFKPDSPMTWGIGFVQVRF